ncbi:pulmonary surfactant-associated protein A-like [Rissa tridactyla]|uniref:pulmonary surfactant-associated protein A-like n=1 Tax=Rissa tridactyla TaxID=75485 RepID=UPI0023BB0A1C|nr:pulmonary surfactant-associated protein A-like [Rissa tridactyla]XP_054060800.1 pulmonary surfactant-associated protein A-like [Rissa tridactyla]
MLSPRLFHKILGVAFLLFPCCAQGKPAGSFPLSSFAQLPEDGIDQGFIPGFLPMVDNEVEDVIRQLEHRISRLEGVLHLEKMITESGGKIFATNGKRADFHATMKKCKEAGGSIATPRNPGENDAILYFVKSFNTYAYLGIKESLIPSKFQFLDGTQLTYTNWYLHEPSGKGEEECVEMYTDGTWNDRKCNQNHLIVCQF